MKAIFFEAHGDISNLRFGELSDPEPAVGQALVRVRAVALNGFDPMVLASIPGLKTPLPMIPGGDVAGEIVGFGPETDTTGFALGDRVLVDPYIPELGGVLGESARGGACELIAIPLTHLVPIPDGVSFEQAAALPIAYGTAHRMLVTRGGISRGDRVLIMGATGGVGMCCLQLAKLVGAEIAACTSSSAKAEKLLALGADHVIDTSKGDFVKALHELWGRPKVFGESGGADIVVNFNGGDAWPQSFRTVKRSGKLLICGATNGHAPVTDLRYIWSFEINVIGSNGWQRSDLDGLLQLVASGTLDPIIDSVRSLEELPRSLQDLIDRRVVGKAVLQVAQ